jgi:hypothetical protein
MQEDRRQNESIEGTPKGDGTVSDEDVKKISGNETGIEGGQDHSTSVQGREEQEPAEGVGAQPDETDRQANVAKTAN